ncbi:MAG TPA: hypothetical protein VMH80_09990 [Bryobacteraceae bacterium]|nr:hypothetical protein [Bryobacteraceae bacterium]
MPKTDVSTTVDELSRAILRALLVDFKERHLAAKDLTCGYRGEDLAMLKQGCCRDTSGSDVDFDLALRDLEESDLIQTGPKVAFDNPPGSSVFVIGFRSKYEYAYLTEKGYKAAQKTQPRGRRTPTAQHVQISGGYFHQSPIGIGHDVSQSFGGTLGDAPVFMNLRRAIEQSSLENDRRTELLAGVAAMKEAPDKPSFMARYTEFIAVAANCMTIISPFVPALTALIKD